MKPITKRKMKFGEPDEFQILQYWQIRGRWRIQRRIKS